jgi:hypothetical protein
LVPRTECHVDWSVLIPEDEWVHDKAAIDVADERNVAFALGGGLAFSEYAGRMRNTKDLDLFILPKDRGAMIEGLCKAGFSDYFDEKPYDRSWIYRAVREHVIVDIIWTMPNHRVVVDEDWLTRGWDIEIRDVCLKLLPPEELLWSKLYVMQKDRCDWPDLLNLLRARSHDLDWDRLFAKSDHDALLLGGLLSVYRWLLPRQAAEAPPWIWERAGLLPVEAIDSEDEHEQRAHLLDSRDWFGPKTTVE